MKFSIVTDDTASPHPSRGTTASTPTVSLVPNPATTQPPLILPVPMCLGHLHLHIPPPPHVAGINSWCVVLFLPQLAFSNRWCAPSAVSLLDCKDLVPPKWTGHPCTTALAGAKRACVCPRLGHLAALHRIHARPLVAAPQGFGLSVRLLRGHTSHLLCSNPSAHSPLPPLDSVLGMHLPSCAWQSLDFTLGHALRPGHQHLGHSGLGFISLASGFDASGPSGQG